MNASAYLDALERDRDVLNGHDPDRKVVWGGFTVAEIRLRNARIRALAGMGVPYAELAAEFDLTRARIGQIVRNGR